jgi:ornithine cyclodeaminase/alanine dehydrogenase-like protein (mu-crystallin family)
MTDKNRIECLLLSQEALLQSGCLDMRMAMSAAEAVMLAIREGKVLFPEKIVQIFNEATQERINCLPATLLPEKICGVKWVSVFPANPEKFGTQNLSAVIVLSEIEQGFPIAFMDGTLCSNMRVAAMGGIAAKHFARQDSKSIGFIGAGEQAKMHLIAMKTVIPSLEECRISAKYDHEEKQFIDELTPLFPTMRFVASGTDARKAMEDADILVTATSAQAPLLKAAWMKPGAFYSHIGGWEDEYAVAQQCDKIVCDNLAQVQKGSRELMEYAARAGNWDSVIPICNLVKERKPRPAGADITIYKFMGMGIADMASAVEILKRARAQGVGTSYPHPHRASPRLT